MLLTIQFINNNYRNCAFSHVITLKKKKTFSSTERGLGNVIRDCYYEMVWIWRIGLLY